MIDIKITAPGLYGKDGQLEVGSVHKVKKIPKSWGGKCLNITELQEAATQAAVEDSSEELAELKRIADEKGITYAANIGVETLRQRIEEADAAGDAG